MLKHTFQHIKGIGSRKELAFWESGVVTWDNFDAIRPKQLLLFKDHEDEIYESPLTLSRVALENEDADYFAKHLSRQEHYRIAQTFPEKTIFLDIETTGLSRYYDTITLVGWSLGKEYGVFIKGANDKAFRLAMSRAKAIVTFNGSIFDIPFLKKEFKNLPIPSCHIDLRFFVRRVGLSGGQKAIETLLKVKRPKSITDITGAEAALLWYKYRWGEVPALKQLIIYNHADVEGMKVIFDKVLKRLLKKKKLPFSMKTIHQFAKCRSKIEWHQEKSNNDSGIKIYPYRGKSGPIITLKELSAHFPKEDLRFVGIDLTGSEDRPSGWCFLDYDNAITERLGTDAELIDKTMELKPTLVSIDSPLSMPTGRISVDDDDPGRDEYGIMRHCERLLKKRGVNVYPSLIPSMQKLTARGMRLATHFRSLGVPVIESYPGAAQDIMGIPRKGLSQEFLSMGLQKFGVKGDYTKNPVSHDELDAITSAIVGLFLWAGKFEGLGNEEEDYLIIPDLHTDSTNWTNRRVIGLSGPIFTGKTTSGEYLKSKDYNYGRFSLVLKELLKKRNIEPSRETLQKIGDEINETPGQRWLCQQLIAMLAEDGNIVIDGLRHPEDHAFMIEIFGPAFLHMHIDSATDIRLARYIADGYNEVDFSKAISHPIEDNVVKLSALAHIEIKNATDIDSLKAKIDTVINRFYFTKGG